MIVLHVRNVHHALPVAIKFLEQEGHVRDSRNGQVIKSSTPVTTVYNYPIERVMLWEERDANPFFHLYESLWMLAGRNDIAPLAKYAPNMLNYSDDGAIQRGAYGHRWRWNNLSNHICEFDQLTVIAARLKTMPDDRRSVLQMWDSNWDLRSTNENKDVPCNVTATFQLDDDGNLDLHVLCRSNDIIWGAYGANAVHFSMLQEYMANWIVRPIGKFYQISVNWHAYVDLFEKMKPLARKMDLAGHVENPYVSGTKMEVTTQRDAIRRYLNTPAIYPVLMPQIPHVDLDRQIHLLLSHADSNAMANCSTYREHPWLYTCYIMLQAHQIYRNKKDDGTHYRNALELLAAGPQKADWIVAGQQWIQRRYDAWKAKQEVVFG